MSSQLNSLSVHSKYHVSVARVARFVKFPLCKERVGLEDNSDRIVRIDVHVRAYQWRRDMKNALEAGVLNYLFTWYPVLVARLEAFVQTSGNVVLNVGHEARSVSLSI